MQRQSIPGNSAGAMNGDGSRKALLHSTEGSSIAGAVAAYRAHNSWPTKTVDLKRRIVAEHLPLTVAARSLRNDPGGADATNKDGTVLIQYELVGSAVSPASIGSDEDWAWFGREVLGPDCRAMGVPLVSTVDWVAYPKSYGKARQRLSPAEWDAYSGVLGHQHAPDNDHGDPGAIPIDIVLGAALGEEDPMAALSDDEQRELLRNTRTIVGRLDDEGAIGRRSKETTIGVRALLTQTPADTLSEVELAAALLPGIVKALDVDAIVAAVPKAVRAELAAALAAS